VEGAKIKVDVGSNYVTNIAVRIYDMDLDIEAIISNEFSYSQWCPGKESQPVDFAIGQERRSHWASKTKTSLTEKRSSTTEKRDRAPAAPEPRSSSHRATTERSAPTPRSEGGGVYKPR